MTGGSNENLNTMMPTDAENVSLLEENYNEPQLKLKPKSSLLAIPSSKKKFTKAASSEADFARE